MVLVSHLLILAKEVCSSRWSFRTGTQILLCNACRDHHVFWKNPNYNSLVKIRHMLIRPLKISSSVQIENRCLCLQSVLVSLGTSSSHNLLHHVPRATAPALITGQAAPVPYTHLCSLPLIISGILLLFSLVRCQTLRIWNSGPEANPLGFLKFACKQCKPQATAVARWQILPLGWEQLSVEVLLG